MTWVVEAERAKVSSLRHAVSTQTTHFAQSAQQLLPLIYAPPVRRIFFVTTLHIHLRVFINTFEAMRRFISKGASGGNLD